MSAQETFSETTQALNGKLKVFISHAHDDSHIAKALADLITGVFDAVEVKYSSAQNNQQGIPGGAAWFDWIRNEVRDSQRAFAVLTPNSHDRPWLLWEAGAIAGVALACRSEKTVIPLLYGIRPEDISGPLKHLQSIPGDTGNGANGILEQFPPLLNPPPDTQTWHRRRDALVPSYLQKIQAALNGGEAVPVPRRLHSKYAVADIKIDLNPDHSQDEKRQNSIFIASSEAADRLFHVSTLFPGEQSLVKKPIYDVFERLEPLCDADQWSAVNQEQKILAYHLLTGDPRPATRPIIFLTGDAAEKANVAPELRGRAFLPLIVQHTFHGHSLDLRMLYLQVCNRPRQAGSYWEVEPYDYWTSADMSEAIKEALGAAGSKDLLAPPGPNPTQAPAGNQEMSNKPPKSRRKKLAAGPANGG